ncbi:MAG: AAA family ATPase [Clostridia bacterium]|nr:AAA family ATPase [Clostridia bacterium]
MKLVLLFGNAAVGKMTVGQELMKITDLRLFHNHMTIEPVLEIFGGFHSEAIRRMREVVFDEFAQSGLGGLIFTFMWAFDRPSDWEYVEHVKQIFKDAEVYYVELTADQSVRLERNRTENRLKHKASKRNLAMSEAILLNDDQKYRCESREGEIPFENYLRIDNTDLSAEEAARRIKAHFGL